MYAQPGGFATVSDTRDSLSMVEKESNKEPGVEICKLYPNLSNVELLRPEENLEDFLVRLWVNEFDYIPPNPTADWHFLKPGLPQSFLHVRPGCQTLRADSPCPCAYHKVFHGYHLTYSPKVVSKAEMGSALPYLIR